ncbi:MAG: AraC family transcriptional regulator [Rhodospirillaceae bacterium]|jgi:transcriptional regulator GlxA family with amidase domain|nr:AraC family transcriptional regulator [Rhodospirillaceae bacterium]MDP6624100.1 GlxA family transcriptional regulator [Alphaproteobacteria bacterium]|tara:strand:+ start:106 stop:1071 length:966 start_codon:yes stop_codon:yes gene_type:complete
MFGDPARRQPQSIGFVLVPHFSMMAFVSAIEPLRSANRISGRQLYDWQLFSADGAEVPASNGIAVVPDAQIGELKGPTTVVVVAGLQVATYNDRTVMNGLRRLARHGTDIGGICTGTHVLARGGLLDGYRCTIHWENIPGLMEAFPQLEVSANLYEIDRDRFTCSGGTAPLDLMLHLIARQHGSELGAEVAEQFMHGIPRQPDSPQRWSLAHRLHVSHPRIIAAIGQMEANLEQPLSRQELADSVGVSLRQLERLFQKYLGKAPARYYLDLRLHRAQLLLSQTTLSVLEVATACGFASASHFSQRYRGLYGWPPRAERQPG